MNMTARKIAKMGVRFDIPSLVRYALEFGNIMPEFNIARFEAIEGLALSGTAKFTTANYDSVEEDIKTAQAFARFLENQYNVAVEVNYNIDNNILDMEINVLDKKLPRNIHDKIIEHFESILLGND